MTAEMKVRDIIIEDDDLMQIAMKSTLETKLKEAFIKAQNKAQEIAAEKTKEIL
jgi:hypothetical protein